MGSAEVLISCFLWCIRRQPMMSIFSRLNNALVAAGGVAFVLVMNMGAVLLRQDQVCDFDDPATCAVVVNDPAETFLEKRDDVYIAKIKADATLTDLRPEHAYQYEAC